MPHLPQPPPNLRMRAPPYRFDFFHTDEIPEETSLDTLLALSVISVIAAGGLRVWDVTDRTVSGLFSSHLWPFLVKTWPSGSAGDHLLWILELRAPMGGWHDASGVRTDRATGAVGEAMPAELSDRAGARGACAQDRLGGLPPLSDQRPASFTAHSRTALEPAPPKSEVASASS